MNLNDWFHKGLTAQEYLDSLTDHQEATMHIYNNFSVPDSDKALLTNKTNIRVIAIVEKWCGHCMLNVPLLLRLTETADIDVRFLPRDENLELMDQYLTNEKRIIPIFIFIDEAGNELSNWGPKAPEIDEYIKKLQADLPAKDAPDYEEKFKIYVTEASKTFESNPTYWHYSFDDIKKHII